MKNIDPNATPERRAAIIHICEPESYLPVVTECIDPAHAKRLRAHHMANFLALSAELFLINYDGIATAFERNNGLEISFKLKLAPEKDNVDISFKPVDVFKDSASATLPDEDQPELFKKESKSPVKKPAEEPPIEVASVPLGLPAPVLGLPAPEATAEEKSELEQAYDAGVAARAAGHPATANPYPMRSKLRKQWKQGFEAPPVIDAEVIEPSQAGEAEKAEAYEAGRTGFHEDLARDHNPHPEGTDLHDAWKAGWQSVADEYLPPDAASTPGGVEIVDEEEEDGPPEEENPA